MTPAKTGWFGSNAPNSRQKPTVNVDGNILVTGSLAGSEVDGATTLALLLAAHGAGRTGARAGSTARAAVLVKASLVDESAGEVIDGEEGLVERVDVLFGGLLPCVGSVGAVGGQISHRLGYLVERVDNGSVQVRALDRDELRRCGPWVADGDSGSELRDGVCEGRRREDNTVAAAASKVGDGDGGR